MKQPSWLELGGVAPETLTEARLTTHWATQIAAAASARLAPRSDFSHTNLAYSAEHGALFTSPIDGVRVGLALAELSLLVADDGGVIQKPLAHTTLASGLAWLQSHLDDRLGSAVELTLLGHDMPHHAVGEGAPFPEPAAPAYAELARWFSNASLVVSEVAAERDGSPARCWPHHFDLASLITVVADEDAERARTVGVGLSPGDDGNAEPYAYVTPWPRPATEALTELAIGRWHTDGWTGAVLGARELLAAGDQRAHLSAFMASAVDAATALSS